MPSYGIPKTRRLATQRDIISALRSPKRAKGALLDVFAVDNSLSHPRLCVVVSRKTSRRAIHRNYAKRAVREWFRREQHDIGGIDIVIRVHSELKRSSFLQVSEELRQHLFWLRQCASYSSD
ncbi:MAG: ribonuclease P protein component [Burkholderiales bacterium]